eukprot:TRINITY_DN20996_c0_g1_i1.p1 TRINITY_DN20996_c0_g1~~TRINITY_DN20996_c0_g1_i1.p1  ORF type:complete len:575 (+),score=191.92 TRINITY_DN20996_c0_g1_i1:73-1797(+)
MVMQLFQEVPAMAALFVCGIIGWCLTRWVNERYATFVEGRFLGEDQKPVGRRGRRAAKKVAEEVWEPEEEAATEEATISLAHSSPTTAKQNAEVRRRMRRQAKAQTPKDSTPETEASLDVVQEAEVQATPALSESSSTGEEVELPATDADEPKTTKEEHSDSLADAEVQASASVEEVAKPTASDATLAEEVEVEVEVQVVESCDQVPSAAPEDPVVEEVVEEPAVATVEDASAAPAIVEEVQVPQIPEQAAPAEEPVIPEQSAPEEEPATTKVEEAAPVEQQLSERVIRLMAKKAERKARKAAEAAALAEAEAEAAAAAAARKDVETDKPDSIQGDDLSTGAGSDSAGGADESEKAPSTVEEDVKDAEQLMPVAWGDAVDEEGELVLPVATQAELKERMRAATGEGLPVAGGDGATAASAPPPPPAPRHVRRRAAPLKHQDGWMASFDDMLVEPQEEGYVYSENIAFTDGQQIYEPIVAEDGQQLYTDGTTVYAVACVRIDEDAPEAAGVLSPQSYDMEMHSGMVGNFGEGSGAPCFEGAVGPLLDLEDLEGVDEDLEWNACWDFKPLAASKGW